MTAVFIPKYEITNILLGIITDIEALRTWIKMSKINLPWLDTIRFETLIKRAHFSTAIEGNPLTLPEVEALALGKEIHVLEKAKREVLNYFAALRWIEKLSPETPVTEKGLLNLHKLLVKDILQKNQAGKWKNKQNYIVSGGNIIYTPPGPKEARPLTLSLIKWLEGSGLSTHPVVSQAIAHYELVRIHPFIDGNGRCARCLSTWILYHRGFDTQHIFAIDQYYKEDHQGYYEAIQRVAKENGDLTSWLEYTAMAVKDTLERTKRRIEELSLSPIEKRIGLTRQQEKLLLHMKDLRGLSIDEIRKILKVKRARVYRILKPLLENKILTKTTTRPVIYKIV